MNNHPFSPSDLVLVQTNQESYIDLIDEINIHTAHFRSGERAPLTACTLLIPSTAIQALAIAATTAPPPSATIDNLLLLLSLARPLLGPSTPLSFTMTNRQTTISTNSYTLTLTHHHQ